MNVQDKTKEELLIGLKELQQEYDSLKISCEKDIANRKNCLLYTSDAADE